MKIKIDGFEFEGEDYEWEKIGKPILKKFHPWLFSDEVITVVSTTNPGSTDKVYGPGYVTLPVPFTPPDGFSGQWNGPVVNLGRCTFCGAQCDTSGKCEHC